MGIPGCNFPHRRQFIFTTNASAYLEESMSVFHYIDVLD